MTATTWAGFFGKFSPTHTSYYLVGIGRTFWVAVLINAFKQAPAFQVNKCAFFIRGNGALVEDGSAAPLSFCLVLPSRHLHCFALAVVA